MGDLSAQLAEVQALHVQAHGVDCGIVNGGRPQDPCIVLRRAWAAMFRAEARRTINRRRRRRGTHGGVGKYSLAAKRAAQERYRLAHPEREQARKAKYRAEHRDDIRTYRAVYRDTYGDKARQAEAAYRAANAEKVRARHALYRETHREEIRARNRARREAGV